MAPPFLKEEKLAKKNLAGFGSTFSKGGKKLNVVSKGYSEGTCDEDVERKDDKNDLWRSSRDVR